MNISAMTTLGIVSKYCINVNGVYMGLVSQSGWVEQICYVAAAGAIVSAKCSYHQLNGTCKRETPLADLDRWCWGGGGLD